MAKRLLQLTVNDRVREDAVADDALLVDYLRDTAGLTGTKQGCDGGECGACTVLIDGVPRLSCITLAASVAGRLADVERLYVNSLMKTHDANEGIAAFLAKRKPSWEHR